MIAAEMLRQALATVLSRVSRALIVVRLGAQRLRRLPASWRRVRPGVLALRRLDRGRGLMSGRAQPIWIVAVTGAFALALCGMFQWMSWHARRTVIDDTYSLSSNLALSVEQFVARTMETVDLTLRMTGAKAVGNDGKHRRDMRRYLADRLRHSPQLTGLMVVTADGRTRIGAGELAKVPSDAFGTGDDVRLARGRADMQLLVGDGVGRGGHAILAVRRITRADGSFAGIAAATLSRDYVQRFLSTLHVGQQGLIGLDAIDGTVLVRQPYRKDAFGTNAASTPLFRQWLPWASSGVFPMQDESDGLWRVVAYQRIDRLPLVVHVGLSQDEALAGWRRATLWQGGVGTVILALAAVTGFMLHRQLQARMRAHDQLGRTVRELERARIAAVESSRVKSQFMANMSHELRTPLNAVIGYSEILLEDGEAKPSQLADLRRIQEAGRHLLGLIEDVLDVSEIEVGRLQLREAMVDLTALIEDCARSVAERVGNSRLTLQTAIPTGLPALLGDAQRLRQVLLNLLSNAVKFTPAGGSIVLSAATMATGGVAVTVRDTGIGMKPEEIPVALEPFRQVDGALSRRYGGAGLGLTLARTLVELHGGLLTIESAPGDGTTVTIVLPPDRVVQRAA